MHSNEGEKNKGKIKLKKKLKNTHEVYPEGKKVSGSRRQVAEGGRKENMEDYRFISPNNLEYHINISNISKKYKHIN